jgi:polysaccharide export outer membrane protein
MWLCRLFVLLLAVLALAACARQPPRQQVAASPVIRSDLDALMYGAPGPAYPASYPAKRVAQVVPVSAVVVPADGPYTLDTGDKLRIVVFGQDTLSNTYTVDAAGVVTMPLIGGVPARGMTTAQLAAAITGRLKQNYLRDPSVAVEVDTYRPFFVLGEVTYPGQYPYVPHMTVESAIAIAGGFTPRGYKDIVIVTRKYQGVPARYKLPLNAPVRPGDTITVSERWF